MTKILAGGVVAAALFIAAPAAAQYYPGYGNPGYGYGGNVVGQVLGQVLGGGYGYNNYGYGGYGTGANSQAAISQCTAAVQARLGGGYNGYGAYGGYGYNGYASGGGHVLGISRIEPRSSGGLTVRGVATSGRYGAGYGGQAPADLTFKCKSDYRGAIVDVDINPAQSNYGYNYAPYPQYGNDYSAYGYRRY